MKTPHERFTELWEHALENCPHVEEFRWRSVRPIPLVVLKSLSNGFRKNFLRILELPAGDFDSDVSQGALFDIGKGSLHELTLLNPTFKLGEKMIHWINEMGPSLRRLHIEVRSCSAPYTIWKLYLLLSYTDASSTS
jgi:hypothetical protein